MLNKELLLAGIPSYKITLTGGSATSDKECAMAGEVVTITTSPPAYRFTQVTINPSVNIDDLRNNKYSFVMPSSDVTVNVTYNQSQAYSVRVNSSAGGSVSSSPSSAKWGDIVTLTILPNSGWGLSSITSPDVSFSGSGNTRTFVMPDRNVTIEASFVEVPPEPGYRKATLTVGAWDKKIANKHYYKRGWGMAYEYVDSEGDTIYSKQFGSISPRVIDFLHIGKNPAFIGSSFNYTCTCAYYVGSPNGEGPDKAFYIDGVKYSRAGSTQEDLKNLLEFLNARLNSTVQVWVEP